MAIQYIFCVLFFATAGPAKSIKEVESTRKTLTDNSACTVGSTYRMGAAEKIFGVYITKTPSPKQTKQRKYNPRVALYAAHLTSRSRTATNMMSMAASTQKE